MQKHVIITTTFKIKKITFYIELVNQYFKLSLKQKFISGSYCKQITHSDGSYFEELTYGHALVIELLRYWQQLWEEWCNNVNEYSSIQLTIKLFSNIIINRALAL